MQHALAIPRTGRLTKAQRHQSSADRAAEPLVPPAVGLERDGVRVRSVHLLQSIRPVRNVDAGALLESLMVYAIAAILVIRVILGATGYPQIGGGGLHIAHMLWGGLLMLVAIVVLVAFLGKSVVRVAAIIGGLG